MLSQSLRALLEFLEGRGEVFIEDVPPDLRRLLSACYGPKWVMRKIRPPEWANPSNWTPLDGGREVVWLTAGPGVRALESARENEGPAENAKRQPVTATLMTEEDKLILDTLAEAYPGTLNQPDLERLTGKPRQKIGERLKWLEKRPRRYVARPPGTKRKGHAITPAGLSAIGRPAPH